MKFKPLLNTLDTPRPFLNTVYCPNDLTAEERKQLEEALIIPRTHTLSEEQVERIMRGLHPFDEQELKNDR